MHVSEDEHFACQLQTTSCGRRHQVHSSGELQRVLRKETEAERKIVRKPSEVQEVPRSTGHAKFGRMVSKECHGTCVGPPQDPPPEKKHSSSGSRPHLLACIDAIVVQPMPVEETLTDRWPFGLQLLIAVGNSCDLGNHMPLFKLPPMRARRRKSTVASLQQWI